MFYYHYYGREVWLNYWKKSEENFRDDDLYANAIEFKLELCGVIAIDDKNSWDKKHEIHYETMKVAIDSNTRLIDELNESNLNFQKVNCIRILDSDNLWDYRVLERCATLDRQQMNNIVSNQGSEWTVEELHATNGCFA